MSSLEKNETINCRGAWRKALSDFWYITRFSFQISLYSVVNDDENLTLHQKSLKALFHTPLQFPIDHFTVVRWVTWPLLTIYTIHPGRNFRWKYSVLQLVQTQNGKITKCTSINKWKVHKEQENALIKLVVYYFWNVSKWNGMYHFIFQPQFPHFPCKW